MYPFSDRVLIVFFLFVVDGFRSFNIIDRFRPVVKVD